MTQRAVLLEALVSTPADVARLMRGLDEAAATWRPEGGQSCRDVVAHLSGSEEHYRAQFQLTLSQDTPVLAPPPTAEDSLLLASDDTALAALTERFAEARAMTLALLQALGPAEWQRPAVHPTGGRTSLRFLVQELVANDIALTSRLVTTRNQAREGGS